MLQNRSGVLVAGVGLLLLNCCLSFWIYQYGPIGRISLEQWKYEVLLSIVTWFIVEVGLIAIMVWFVRSQERAGAAEVA